MIVAAFACVVAASAGAAPLVWVLNPAKGSVSTIDPRTNQEVGATIETGAGPKSIAITPNGKRAFVANSTGKSVTVIETETRKPIATISLAGPAEQVAISPNGGMAYVTTGSNKEVVAINTETTAEIWSTPFGEAVSAVAVSPNGELVYVGFAAGAVQAVNAKNGNLVNSPIPVGGAPEVIAFKPKGETAYVAAGEKVAVIENGHLPKEVSIGVPTSGLAISPDGSRLYVTSAVGKDVTIINTTANEVVGTPITVAGEPEEIAMTAGGGTAYVANASTEELTPINLTTNVPGTPLALPGSGGRLAIAPDQPPTAAFTFTPPAPFTGTAVTFSGASSTDPDGSIASYQWSLNDAASPTGLSVSHTFLNPGTYFTILTLTDDEGCSVVEVFTGRTAYCNGSSVASVTHPVTVTQPPTLCSSRFSVGRMIHNRKNGTVRLQVKLRSAGSLLLFGRKVHAVTRKVKAAGSMFLTIHARVELNKRLKRIHRTSVRIRVTFTPSAGCGFRTIHRSIILLHAKKHRHR